MNNTVIDLLKWIFLLIGFALLGVGIMSGGAGLYVVGGIGLVFAAIGGGILWYGHHKAREAAELKQNGRLIDARVTGVEVNESLEVNGENPFRIVAQWHDKACNQVFVFKSANLWFDPSEFVTEKMDIPVYIDPAKPSRYHMDLSFLPSKGN